MSIQVCLGIKFFLESFDVLNSTRGHLSLHLVIKSFFSSEGGEGREVREVRAVWEMREVRDGRVLGGDLHVFLYACMHVCMSCAGR